MVKPPSDRAQVVPFGSSYVGRLVPKLLQGAAYRAAYRIRTGDLRITRSPGLRSGSATCTDRSAPAPECTQRTVCPDFPVHDSVHGRAGLVVTACYQCLARQAEHGG
jgi:hypothetical protein